MENDFKKSIADFTTKLTELKNDMDARIKSTKKEDTVEDTPEKTEAQDTTNIELQEKAKTLQTQLDTLIAEKKVATETEIKTATEEKEKSATPETIVPTEEQINTLLGKFATEKGINLADAEVTFVIKENRKSIVDDDTDMKTKSAQDEEDEIESNPQNGLTKAFSSVIFGK